MDLIAQSNLIPYRKGNLWGYCDANKKIILPCQYENAFPFVENRAMVQLNKKVGFIDETGKVIIPIQYDYLLDSHFFYNGLAKVRLGNQDENAVGFIDKIGKIIIPLAHYLAADFNNGLVRVGILQGSQLLFGFYNLKGELVIPIQYEKISNFDKNGFAYIIEKENTSFKHSVIDKTGKVILTLKNQFLKSQFNENLAVFSEESNYFDKNNRKIITQKEGYLDINGKIIIPAKFYRAYPFSEGFARIQETEFSLNYLINRQGNTIHSKGYQAMGSAVSEGLITIMENGKYGYLDTLGKEIIPCQYDKAGDFYQGTAIVEIGKKYTIITRTGQQISDLYDLPPNQAFGTFHEGLLAVYQKNAENQGKWGYIDTFGRLVIACKYDETTPFFNGLARVYRKNGDNWQSGYIDKKGIEYWEQ